jgi:hypothetical protein
MLSRLIVLALAVAPAVKLSPAVDGRNGARTQELRFTDKAGEHLVRFDFSSIKEKPEKGDDMGSRSQQLQITHTVGKKEVWKAKDFVNGCPFDLTLELVDGSIEVTDLDDDGEAEISFLYKLTCRSDVSPLSGKLLMYEGATKYAVRGDTRERVGEKEYMGGQYTLDPAFASAPKPFVEFAKAKWQRLIVDGAEVP